MYYTVLYVPDYVGLGSVADASLRDLEDGVLLGHEWRVEDLGDALLALALLQHHAGRARVRQHVAT
jgi:hypothetical protein